MGTETFARGQHVTAGTKTVHLVMNVRSTGQPYVFCSATIGNRAEVTKASVTCKTCAKHISEV